MSKKGKCRLDFYGVVDESQLQELIEDKVGGPVTILGWHEIERSPQKYSKEDMEALEKASMEKCNFSERITISVEYEKEEDD